MDANTTIVIALIVFTFAVALVIGVWQWSNARRAKQRHERSSVGESLRHESQRADPARPDPARPDSALPDPALPDSTRPFPARPSTPSSLAGEQERVAQAQRQRRQA